MKLVRTAFDRILKESRRVYSKRTTKNEGDRQTTIEIVYGTTIIKKMKRRRRRRRPKRQPVANQNNFSRRRQSTKENGGRQRKVLKSDLKPANRKRGKEKESINDFDLSME